MSRRALIEQYGKDIWVRDKVGQNVNYDELRETPARTIQPTDRSQVLRSRSGGNESNDGGRIIIV